MILLRTVSGQLYALVENPGEQEVWKINSRIEIDEIILVPHKNGGVEVRNTVYNCRYPHLYIPEVGAGQLAFPRLGQKVYSDLSKELQQRSNSDSSSIGELSTLIQAYATLELQASNWVNLVTVGEPLTELEYPVQTVEAYHKDGGPIYGLPNVGTDMRLSKTEGQEDLNPITELIDHIRPAVQQGRIAPPQWTKESIHQFVQS